MLGRGVCSYVFRGKIGIWKMVLVIKRFDKEDKEFLKFFCRELMIVSFFYSLNIVFFFGFCIDFEEGLFLVYKYVLGGSFEYYLYGKRKVLLFFLLFYRLKLILKIDVSFWFFLLIDKKKKKGMKVVLFWLVRYKVVLGIVDVIVYLYNGIE